ncbi:MAG TPA: hypothetical protein VGF67_23450, partial [Ktedonobacteraceae bacterium]
MLWQGKLQIAKRIGSAALKADAACSVTCAYMALTLLAGLLLNGLLGWWWADPLAALALIYFLLYEGREAWHQARIEIGRRLGSGMQPAGLHMAFLTAPVDPAAEKYGAHTKGRAAAPESSAPLPPALPEGKAGQDDKERSYPCHPDPGFSVPAGSQNRQKPQARMGGSEHAHACRFPQSLPVDRPERIVGRGFLLFQVGTAAACCVHRQRDCLPGQATGRARPESHRVGRGRREINIGIFPPAFSSRALTRWTS